MKFAMLITVTGLLTLSAGSMAVGQEYKTPKELFSQLQKHFDANEHKEVVRIGQQIEKIDKYGEKHPETVSVYAIMAGSYAILGREAEKAGDLKAALGYFKRAASCNRSFGVLYSWPSAFE